MDESCFPYTAKDSPCGVPQNCRRIYAGDYYYVGGFYGGCSEMAMMLELVNNGPVGVAFEVKLLLTVSYLGFLFCSVWFLLSRFCFEFWERL